MNEIVMVETGARELDPAQVKQQVKMISELMRSVLKEDVHFGKIPGCGDKPALLQPGAQKLGAMFNIGPRYQVTSNDLGDGHREYEIVCELFHRGSGRFLGEGVGVCSTMESKYRYRWDKTDEDVPKEYWNTRDTDLLGGPSFTARKSGNQWKIYQRVEHDNPADYYNTVKKIAKKRAYNDAILTCTAAGDLFVPDDDVSEELIHGNEANDQTQPKKTVEQPQSRSGKTTTHDSSQATDKQIKMIKARLHSAGITEQECCIQFQLETMDAMPFSVVNDVLAWISEHAG